MRWCLVLIKYPESLINLPYRQTWKPSRHKTLSTGAAQPCPCHLRFLPGARSPWFGGGGHGGRGSLVSQLGSEVIANLV